MATIKAQYDAVVARLKTANALVKTQATQITTLQGQVSLLQTTSIPVSPAKAQKLRDLGISDADIDAIEALTLLDPMA